MRWGFIAAGFIAYLVALAILAPATLVDAALQRASGAQLRLADAQGSLWRGTGRLEIPDAAGDAAITRQLVWNIRPASLLLGRVTADVSLGDVSRRFTVIVSGSRVQIVGADVSLPAAVLALAVPKLAPLQLTGDVSVRAEHLLLTRGAMRGSAIVLWRAAGSALAPVSPLGDYEIRLDGKGPSVGISLRTLTGVLQAEGQGTWSAGSTPVFRGTARVSPEHQAQLVPLLQLIAVQRGPGTFDLGLK